jgi:hypothetical protein
VEVELLTHRGTPAFTAVFDLRRVV